MPKRVRSFLLLENAEQSFKTFKSELNCKVQHLALAWLCAKPHTSTVILGASKPEQVLDNLKALEVLPKLTPPVLEKIETIIGTKPAPVVSSFHLFMLHSPVAD
jgi:aryl-alcohol dehydrogenase-like predicted oxidoreductase